MGRRAFADRVPAAPEFFGLKSTGRIVTLMVGQAIGFIRLNDDSKVFFHRSDLQPGTSINELQLGDAVEFELVDDLVSGARAMRVRRLFAISGNPT